MFLTLNEKNIKEWEIKSRRRRKGKLKCLNWPVNMILEYSD